MPALLFRITFKVLEALPSKVVKLHVNSSPFLLKFKGTLNFRLVQVSLLLISTPSLIGDPYILINILKVLKIPFLGPIKLYDLIGYKPYY